MYTIQLSPFLSISFSFCNEMKSLKKEKNSFPYLRSYAKNHEEEGLGNDF